MIIYLSGKMTGLPDLGRVKFNDWEAHLQREGHIVLNPARLPVGLAAEAYMPRRATSNFQFEPVRFGHRPNLKSPAGISTSRLAMLQQTEAILMLEDWRESRGARMERAYARYQGKTVLYAGK